MVASASDVGEFCAAVAVMFSSILLLAFSFSGLFLLSHWLSFFGLVGDRGTLCGTLSVVKSVVRVFGAKLGLVGIEAIRPFIALRILE